MTGRGTAAASLKPTAPRLCARRVHAYMSLTKKGDGQVPIDKGLLRWRALQHRRHFSAEGASREWLPIGQRHFKWAPSRMFLRRVHPCGALFVHPEHCEPLNSRP